MPKMIPFTGKTKTAFGKPFPPAADGTIRTELSYGGEYPAFANIEDVRSTNSFPSDTKIVRYLNAKAKAAYKQRSMVEALKAIGIEKPDEKNDPVIRLKKMAKLLMLDGMEKELARAKASEMLNLEWPDDDDDDDED